MFLGRPLTLLRFDAPEYVLDREHGSVRWRIRDGPAGRARRPGLRLPGACRHPSRGRDDGERERILIEVEVANFYPAIAAGFSVPVYEVTQSAIHVLVTHAFLRSLARLDLAKSRWAASPRRTPTSARRPAA